MTAVWLTTMAAGIAAAACVSPVDYGSPADGPEARCDPDGHDEDGDCINDKQDLCPMLPHSGSADSDGDGIGDACDPHPDRPELRYLFAGFGPTDSPWEWGGDADWNIHADHLVVDLLPTPEVELPQGGAYYSTPMPAPVTIVAQFWIDHQGPRGEVSLFAEYLRVPDSGSECFVSREDRSLGWSRVNGGIRDTQLNTPLAMDPVIDDGVRFQLRIEHGYNDIDDAPAGTSCSFSTDGGATTTVRNDTARSGPGHLRIAARDIRMHVEWVAVYTDEATVPELRRTPRP